MKISLAGTPARLTFGHADLLWMPTLHRLLPLAGAGAADQ